MVPETVDAVLTLVVVVLVFVALGWLIGSPADRRQARAELELANRILDRTRQISDAAASARLERLQRNTDQANL